MIEGELVIRADADTRIGTGHVMRCLALAQAWQAGGGIVGFVCRTLPPPLLSRLEAEDINVVMVPEDADDALFTANYAEGSDARWVVVDGYQFDAAYQKTIRDEGSPLLLLDDNGDADFYWADLVLNQNIHADAGWYESRAPHTRLLLGTQYALLRSEFREWAHKYRNSPQTVRSGTVRSALVTLGGSDPDNVTQTVLDALARAAVPGLEATIVIGGGNPHRDSLDAAARAGFPTRLIVNADNMPELMAGADIAVSAAGSTVWELAYMGVPSLLIVTADNQRGIASGMDNAGAAVSLGLAGALTPYGLAQTIAQFCRDREQRTELSRRARQLVDGLGAERVLAQCLSR